MKHKKYLPVMATVSAVILFAGCRGIKDTGDKESIMEKSRLLAAEDTTVESTQVMTEMETQEETVAQQIADSITGNSDLEKVRQAAQIVAEYSWNAVYTTEDPDYQTAYGVLCKGVYTCAGSTRALGLVLECMGYSWSHVNENQWSHQWCSVVMDGQQGWADGMGGIADYGECPFATGGTYVDSDGQWYIIP